MNQEGKFWATLWALVATCLIGIVVATYLYNVQRDEKVTEMVKQGANPIYAACSLGGLLDSTCNLYAARDQTK